MKRHLNGVSDRIVRRCFTGKNEGNGGKKYLISVKYQAKQWLDCKVNGQKINGSCKNRKKSAHKFTLMKFAVDKFRHEKTCINI